MPISPPVEMASSRMVVAISLMMAVRRGTEVSSNWRRRGHVPDDGERERRRPGGSRGSDRNLEAPTGRSVKGTRPQFLP